MIRRLVGLWLACALALGAAPVWGTKLPDGRLVRAADQALVSTRQGVFTDGSGATAIDTDDGRLSLVDAHVAGGNRVDVTVATDLGRTVATDLSCGSAAGGISLTRSAGRTLALLVHNGGECTAGGRVLRGDGEPALLLLDLSDPARPALRSTVPLPDAAGVTAMHPDGRWAYVPAAVLDQARGQLHVVDLHDLDKPRLRRTVALATGIPSPSLAIDPDGSYLYAAAGTHTMVMDLADPAHPVIEGRIYDYMVRHHSAVAVTDVVDEFFGIRRFLTVTARLGGGDGCPTGKIYVYDLTGELRTRPIMVAESDIPELDEHGLPDPEHPARGECPTPTATLERDHLRMRVTWALGLDPSTEATDPVELRRDWFAYDTTPAFQDAADFCVLVPV